MQETPHGGNTGTLTTLHTGALQSVNPGDPAYYLSSCLLVLLPTFLLPKSSSQVTEAILLLEYFFLAT